MALRDGIEFNGFRFSVQQVNTYFIEVEPSEEDNSTEDDCSTRKQIESVENFEIARGHLSLEALLEPVSDGQLHLESSHVSLQTPAEDIQACLSDCSGPAVNDQLGDLQDRQTHAFSGHGSLVVSVAINAPTEAEDSLE